MNTLLRLPVDGESAVAKVTTQLNGAGLRVTRSFDLQSACASYPDKTCPHHGKGNCDCQLVVLLVYADEEQPASLMLHACNDVTRVGLAAGPGQATSPRLEKRLVAALEPIKSELPLAVMENHQNQH